MLTTDQISAAMKLRLDDELPPKKEFQEGIRRAPDRGFRLSESQTKTALKNALRYIHPRHHAELIPEFLQELKERGRIYGYRFRPEGRLYAKPVDEYTGKCLAGKAFQLQIQNNLDFEVALYPLDAVQADHEVS